MVSIKARRDVRFRFYLPFSQCLLGVNTFLHRFANQYLRCRKWKSSNIIFPYETADAQNCRASRRVTSANGHWNKFHVTIRYGGMSHVRDEKESVPYGTLFDAQSYFIFYQFRCWWFHHKLTAECEIFRIWFLYCCRRWRAKNSLSVLTR